MEFAEFVGNILGAMRRSSREARRSRAPRGKTAVIVQKLFYGSHDNDKKFVDFTEFVGNILGAMRRSSREARRSRAPRGTTAVIVQKLFYGSHDNDKQFV
ncbi:MAG: hypothetical protein ACOYJG_11205 [Prevotella sp.]